MMQKKQFSVWGPYKSRVIGKKKYHLLHNRADLRRSSWAIWHVRQVSTQNQEFLKSYTGLFCPSVGILKLKLMGTDSPLIQHGCTSGTWEDLTFRSTPTQAFFMDLICRWYISHWQRAFVSMRLHVGGSVQKCLKQTLVGFAESLDDWATGAVGTKRLPVL